MILMKCTYLLIKIIILEILFALAVVLCLGEGSPAQSEVQPGFEHSYTVTVFCL